MRWIGSKLLSSKFYVARMSRRLHRFRMQIALTGTGAGTLIITARQSVYKTSMAGSKKAEGARFDIKNTLVRTDCAIKSLWFMIRISDQRATDQAETA